MMNTGALYWHPTGTLFSEYVPHLTKYVNGEHRNPFPLIEHRLPCCEPHFFKATELFHKILSPNIVIFRRFPSQFYLSGSSQCAHCKHEIDVAAIVDRCRQAGNDPGMDPIEDTGNGAWMRVVRRLNSFPPAVRALASTALTVMLIVFRVFSEIPEEILMKNFKFNVCIKTFYFSTAFLFLLSVGLTTIHWTQCITYITKTNRTFFDLFATPATFVAEAQENLVRVR